MSTQVWAFVLAERSTRDAIGLVGAVESALVGAHSVLVRMRALAMQAASINTTATDRSFLDTKFQALKDELGRTRRSARFNGERLFLLDASKSQVQSSLGDAGFDQWARTFGGRGLSTITGSNVEIGGSAIDNARAALGVIDHALSIVSTELSRYGASRSRLKSIVSVIETMRLNQSAAVSHIRDVDTATDTAAQLRNRLPS